VAFARCEERSGLHGSGGSSPVSPLCSRRWTRDNTTTVVDDWGAVDQCDAWNRRACLVRVGGRMPCPSLPSASADIGRKKETMVAGMNRRRKLSWR
jgi:hypothetical protein